VLACHPTQHSAALDSIRSTWDSRQVLLGAVGVLSTFGAATCHQHISVLLSVLVPHPAVTHLTAVPLRAGRLALLT
jgi:hypothetical protein